MGSQRFCAVIAAGPRDSGVIAMPFDPDEAWGAKADHPVGGTIDGWRIRARLVPVGSGWVLTLAPKRLRGMGVAIGDDVTVELAPEGPQRGDIVGQPGRGRILRYAGAVLPQGLSTLDRCDHSPAGPPRRQDRRGRRPARGGDQGAATIMRAGPPPADIAVAEGHR